MTKEERFWNKVHKTEDINLCWNWNAALRAGYGVMKWNGKLESAHRISYHIHNENMDLNLVVCHICDNKLCVNPNHLFLGTQSENMIDAMNKGRLIIPEGIKFITGHKAHNSNVKDDIVKEIIQLIKFRKNNNQKLKLKEIAEIFNINYNTIRDISSGRSYINL